MSAFLPDSDSASRSDLTVRVVSFLLDKRALPFVMDDAASLAPSSWVSVRAVIPTVDGLIGRVVLVDAAEFERKIPESAEDRGNDCLGAPLGRRRYLARLIIESVSYRRSVKKAVLTRRL